MAQQQEIEISFFESGYCTAHASIADPVNGKGKCRFYAIWALLKHPEKGYLLFDTGYSKRFFEATGNFPDRIYRWATPVTIDENESAAKILERRGIRPEQINYVIVSHFHGDHICGLKDFPSATFICSESSFNQMNSCTGISAVSKGILKELIPEDFNRRVQFIENIGSPCQREKGPLMYDLFGDGTIGVILLPGHARGMLGFVARCDGKLFCFATDASWSRSTWIKRILPRRIVKLFFDSWNDFIGTQEELRSFQNENPDAIVLFTHCPETLKYVKSRV